MSALVNVNARLPTEVVAALDAEARLLGVSRSEVFRRRLSASDGPESGSSERPLPSREDALRLLHRAAEAGSGPAAASLEKALREAPVDAEDEPITFEEAQRQHEERNRLRSVS